MCTHRFLRTPVSIINSVFLEVYELQYKRSSCNKESQSVMDQSKSLSLSHANFQHRSQALPHKAVQGLCGRGCSVTSTVVSVSVSKVTVAVATTIQLMGSRKCMFRESRGPLRRARKLHTPLPASKQDPERLTEASLQRERIATCTKCTVKLVAVYLCVLGLNINLSGSAFFYMYNLKVQSYYFQGPLQL